MLTRSHVHVLVLPGVLYNLRSWAILRTQIASITASYLVCSDHHLSCCSFGSSTLLDNAWQLLVSIFSPACGADWLTISISWWGGWIQRSGPKQIIVLLSVKPTKRQNPEWIIPIEKYHVWIQRPVGLHIPLYHCIRAPYSLFTADILTYHSKETQGLLLWLQHLSPSVSVSPTYVTVSQPEQYEDTEILATSVVCAV